MRQNRSSRPLYFAVTVPPGQFSDFHDNLQNEGLCYKLVANKTENSIDVEKLENNLYKLYRFDGIFTKDWQREHLFLSCPGSCVG